jgi:uroporphyrinogen decarboxylase
LLCQEVDRVPLAEVLIDEEAKEAFLGKAISNLSTDIEFYLAAGYDYVSLGRRIAGFPGVWDAARFENYYEAQRAVGHGRMTGRIGGRWDLKNYPWVKRGDLDFRILDQAEKLLPKEMKVIRYLGPVFQLTWILMGFEAFSYKLVDDPGLVEAVFEKIFEIVYWEFEDALEREIVGTIWYLDDIAMKGRLMVSPAFLRKNLFPRIKLMTARCKERGVPFIYHTDGDVGVVLPDIIDAGVSALHPIDPTTMDIYATKEKVKGRLGIVGNIDLDLLLRGTPDDIRQDTKQHLQRLGPGGGYVVSSSNSIHRNVKVQNYRALLETTLRHGRYPL